MDVCHKIFIKIQNIFGEDSRHQNNDKNSSIQIQNTYTYILTKLN